MIKDRTTAYAKLVVSGKKIAGRKEYLACKRHLDDLKNKKLDYKFDVEEAEFAINFANTLTLKDGTNLKTRGFQDFIIGSLHGWKKKEQKKEDLERLICRWAGEMVKAFYQVLNQQCSVQS